ncbi:diguanylate cyclase [Stutzerimonas urumqiensis]|uniref:sensor domain-containing diguanylate cyclase n=1 Tax=Stutzerimonas urumqiensis TaxID=638269 RepID=UPI003BACD28E
MTTEDAARDADRREIQRLRELIAHNSDWLWEVDAQGRYTFCSEHSLALLGYPPQDVLGRTPFDFMPPAEAERVGAEFAAIVAERRPFAGLINRNLHADGRVRVLETSGIPLFADDGSLAGYRGIDRDITPLIGSLSPRLVQLEALYAAAPVALGLIDRTGCFVTANRALCQLLNPGSGASLIGLLAADYLPADQLDVTELFTRLLDAERLPAQPLERDGRAYQASVQAVRASDDALIGLTLAITDVTELQRIRRQLAETNAQLERANARLSELAETDHLTALPNRRRFDETLQIETARALHEGTPLSLLLIDVDFFKRYNDRYGHQAGDECLRLLARLLREIVQRPTDLPCRFGGEEFAIVLPATGAAAAQQVAERLRHRLHGCAVPHGSSPAGRITVSIGTATLDEQPTVTGPLRLGELAASLVEVADRCLYLAKREGRNQVMAARV